MNAETLKRANEIAERIKFCQTNIKMAKHTQYDHVVPRTMECRFNGDAGKAMTVPEALWRVVGKLVLAEYQQELAALEKEFNNL